VGDGVDQVLFSGASQGEAGERGGLTGGDGRSGRSIVERRANDEVT